MSRFCDSCGKELGIQSTIRTSEDGRVVAVCASCAAPTLPRTGFEGEPMPPAWSEPAIRPAPYVRTSQRSLVLPLVALGMSVLFVVGGAVLVLFLARKPKTPGPIARTPSVLPSANESPEQGQLPQSSWTGSQTFKCQGDDQVVVRDCKGESGTTAFRAEGRCKLTLIGCQIVGNPVLEALGEAEVLFKGGALSVPKDRRSTALKLSEQAAVTLEGVTLQGNEQAARLSGTSALTLRNTRIVRFDDDKMNNPWPSGLELEQDAELVIEGGLVEWLGHGVRLGGSSLLLARDATITSRAGGRGGREPTGLSAIRGSTAQVIGGELRGPRVALSAEDSTSVWLEGTRLQGEIAKKGNAVVNTAKTTMHSETSVAELLTLVRNRRQESKKEHEKLSRYSAQACEGVFACYADNFPGGAVSGTVTRRVNAEGKVQSTTLQGTFPAKVASCITALGKAKTVTGFEGPPGELICQYSGTITKGTQMLSVSSEYRKASSATPALQGR